MTGTRDRNEISDVVDALYQVKIAVESLNPDPQQTIAEHRRRQRSVRRLAMYSAVVSTVAAVGVLVQVLL